ncbi:MAG: transposase, partial [Nanoarchaeota archaeon]
KIKEIRFKSTICRKFIKHLCTRDRENLFRFVTNPEVDSTNNRAERGLRHDVIIRKISGGNRSNLGARIHECLLSVIQTYKLQNKNILTEGLSYLKQELQTTK